MSDELSDVQEIRKLTENRAEAEKFELMAEGNKEGQKIADKLIAELNEKHAIARLGGKTVIINEVIDPTFNRPDVTFSTVQDFRNFYANRKITSQKKTIGLGTAWLNSPKRRQYEGIVFSPKKKIPGYYNLYKGLAVEPSKGDWSLYREHIFHIIANKNEEHYKWLMAWLADKVQNIGGEMPGTAIVLRGNQGTGKGCFVSQYGEIFGCHYLPIVDQNQLTGRFNNHLKNALVVFCDEAIWAGNKSAEGALKSIITEDYIRVEPKGKDPFTVKNHISLIIASNNDWVIPAGLEERRFFVLDVSNEREQDQKYFRAIFQQMANGGREAMLYDLLNLDISGIDLRTCPRTEALLDQILNSIDPVNKFWFEVLNDGFLEAETYFDGQRLGIWDDSVSDNMGGEIKLDTIHEAYIEHASKIGVRHRKSKDLFSKLLGKICPGMKRKRRMRKGVRERFLVFPPLDDCRRSFERFAKMPIDWAEE